VKRRGNRDPALLQCGGHTEPKAPLPDPRGVFFEREAVHARTESAEAQAKVGVMEKGDIDTVNEQLETTRQKGIPSHRVRAMLLAYDRHSNER